MSDTCVAVISVLFTRHVSRNEKCDACRSFLMGVRRIICLVCTSEHHQIDLCPDCIISPTPDTPTGFKHQINHDVMQIRFPITSRMNKVYLYEAGRRAAMSGKSAWADMSLSSPTDLVCHICRDPLTLPCWYCAECGALVPL